ncbi:galactinol--sucrose galactosyltransferase [Beta vulgaris subsp. vulgaris]|uniref:galactinol--sucrose galactosyltransferase n=1 Tax=Beta vulgaris subsp. vulgaris TaxID=3555 RepID=UPI002036D81A|nr:galactinol--sucrose galactosyltransferase [Beta vulgaris subsp. vulgaris]
MAPSLTKGALESMGLLDGATPSSITLEASTFFANGHPFFTHVPPNISVTSLENNPLKATHTATSTGCFIGFHVDEPESRHVVPIGKLKGIRFMSIFRFKVWWTTHWTGTCGNDVEYETQMMMLENNELGRPYVLLVPILEGPFRASLQPNPTRNDDVCICVESGSTREIGSNFRSCLYMDSGFDPYDLVHDAFQVIQAYLGTFKLLKEKNPPGIVDKFGWCTWDAFYLKVNPEGIQEGVRHLTQGGCPPGLVLIDDGWQSISHDCDPITQEGMDLTSPGEQMPCRLVKYMENYKFRNYESPKGKGKGLKAFVKDLKEEFRTIEHVYVWHALMGYWGGIRPNVPNMPKSKVISPKLSKGLQMTMEDLAVDKIVENGVGLVPPEKVEEMYEGLHSHLEAAGIDGVKVDVIHLLEMLSEDYGGRVELAKAYYKALTASVKKHFKGNGVIASMQHCNDFMLLGTQTICLGRVGDDFWCTDPNGDPNGTYWLQGIHMVHCAYNSLWMGNFIHPDWDMFQSTHPCAEFHAASRAISGGPVYVSDCVGQHNFELLKKLVLPDGSILRCQHYALPTRDCLFEDPLHDGKTMLKIWNLNKYTGVIGAFNCQGGGWCPQMRRNKAASEFSHPVTCFTNPNDVEWSKGKNSISTEGVNIFAVYAFKEKKLRLLKPNENIQLSLDSFDFELLTVAPVKLVGANMIQFAPIGLVNMLNSSGAIDSLLFQDEENMVKVRVKGAGDFKVFSSQKPRCCRVNGKNVTFSYRDCIVGIQILLQDHVSRLSMVEFEF